MSHTKTSFAGKKCQGSMFRRDVLQEEKSLMRWDGIFLGCVEPSIKAMRGRTFSDGWQLRDIQEINKVRFLTFLSVKTREGQGESGS